MSIARMYLHITRTQQGDENCYISSRHFCNPALSYLHYTTSTVGIAVQLNLHLTLLILTFFSHVSLHFINSFIHSFKANNFKNKFPPLKIFLNLLTIPLYPKEILI